MNTRTIIFTFIAAMFAVERAAPKGLPDGPRPASVASSEHRSLSAIHADVRAALRAEALTRRQGQNVPEIIRLLDLYREMAAHPRRNESMMLAKLGLRVRSRLETVRDQIERQFKPPTRGAKKAHDIPETRVLAQQIAVQAGGAFGQAAQPGADGAVDYGPELVEIIQQTISPATWNINGGNGAIVYFTPRRAIVISAPEAVHEQVNDLLGQLRAAP
jgi:hypothetical protein